MEDKQTKKYLAYSKLITESLNQFIDDEYIVYGLTRAKQFIKEYTIAFKTAYSFTKQTFNKIKFRQISLNESQQKQYDAINIVTDRIKLIKQNEKNVDEVFKSPDKRKSIIKTIHIMEAEKIKEKYKRDELDKKLFWMNILENTLKTLNNSLAGIINIDIKSYTWESLELIYASYKEDDLEAKIKADTQDLIENYISYMDDDKQLVDYENEVIHNPLAFCFIGRWKEDNKQLMNEAKINFEKLCSIKL
jgi:hypothetical protein